MRKRLDGILPLTIAVGIMATVTLLVAISIIPGVTQSNANGSERLVRPSDTNVTAFDAIASTVGVQPYENVVPISGETDIDKMASKLEVSKEKASKIVELSETNGTTTDQYSEVLGNDVIYEVSGNAEGNVSVHLPFASKRLVVPCSESISFSETNPTSETYDFLTGSRIMTYDTMESTLRAYETIKEKMGDESVMVDVKVHAMGRNTAYDGWGVSDMGLSQTADALDAYPRTAPVKVAVIDTGIRRDHEAFSGVTIDSESGSIMSVRKTALSSSNYDDDDGHGTHVASIITSGTPDKVSLLVLKCLDETGNGSLYDIYYAVKYAASKGAGVINLSLASDLGTGISAQSNIAVFDRAMKAATSSGSIIVTAASNENQDINAVNTYPAVSKYTQTVGALDQNGQRASYSNYGQALDFMAPGTDLTGAWNSSNNAKQQNSGTSLSAPHVAALFANLRCRYPEESADAIVARARSLSVDLGDPGKDAYYGYGKPKLDASLFVPTITEVPQDNSDVLAPSIPEETAQPLQPSQPSEQPSQQPTQNNQNQENTENNQQNMDNDSSQPNFNPDYNQEYYENENVDEHSSLSELPLSQALENYNNRNNNQIYNNHNNQMDVSKTSIDSNSERNIEKVSDKLLVSEYDFGNPDYIVTNLISDPNNPYRIPKSTSKIFDANTLRLAYIPWGSFDEIELKLNQDYKIVGYKNNYLAENATGVQPAYLTVQGIGKFKNEITFCFYIAPEAEQNTITNISNTRRY